MDFFISVHSSQVEALSALSPLLRFLVFQMKTADFLFQTSIFWESLHLSQEM